MLFSDIEGSTALVSALGDRYGEALSAQRALLRAVFSVCGGREMGTEGDSFFVVFESAGDAVRCCVAGQRALSAQDWPGGIAVRVRMGLHSGEPARHEDGYIGLDVHRAARIAAAAHGGQVVLSEATRLLVGSRLPADVSVRDLGYHRLKDIEAPERIYQLVAPGLRERFPSLKSLGSAPVKTARVGNLPLQVSSFIGRERELEQTRAALARARVVTLTGAGGVGKTRLALRAAGQVAGRFADGSWLCELAPVGDPAGVDGAVAAVFSVTARAGQSTRDVVVEFLRTKQLLLVLDNCEHLLDGAAVLADDLARSCERLVILATSREGLGIEGERLVPVPPLGVPEADADLAAVTGAEAVRLFAERAAAVKPGFAVTAGNAAAVAAVVWRLDGIALAVELAAARVPALTPAELARRLERSFAVLAAGRRGGVERHQTLGAAIDWSFQLLPAPDQALLARLAVFAGGATLEAAEIVCGGEGIDPGAVFELLAALVARSLVVAEENGLETRYRLLETIRQFAAGRLAASGEEAAVHARLLRWALEIARSAEAALSTDRWTGWSAMLSAEQANIRAALSWALGGQESDAGRELAARLARWWIATGRHSEAGQFLTTAASIPTAAAPGIQARVLLGAAWSAYHLGDNRRAGPLAAEGVARAGQAGEPQLELWGHNLLAGLAWVAGDADRIVAEIEASRGLSGQTDPALAARALVLLANAAFLSGDLAEQERHALFAVELARTAAGQEGLPLALTVWSGGAIAGAGIQPATVAAVDEAANLIAAHPDRFTETILRSWRAQMFAALGQLDAAETEVGLCWAAGRSGAARLVEIIGPVAEARLAAARGDATAAIGALRRSADAGRRHAVGMFLPAALAFLACMAAIAGDESTGAAAVGEARAELGQRRQAITAAALGYAEGVMAWHRGELADAEHLVREATVQWHRCGDRMGACDGIELLGVLAAARERFPDATRLLAAADAARRPLRYLAPGFTANRGAAARALSQARRILGDSFTQAQKEGQGFTLDDAVAYAARKGSGRPPRSC